MGLFGVCFTRIDFNFFRALFFDVQDISRPKYFSEENPFEYCVIILDFEKNCVHKSKRKPKAGIFLEYLASNKKYIRSCLLFKVPDYQFLKIPVREINPADRD